MVDQFLGKSIPFAQYEEFKNLYQGCVLSFVSQYDIKRLSKADFESNMARSFYDIHQLLTRILKENNIITSVQEETAD